MGKIAFLAFTPPVWQVQWAELVGPISQTLPERMPRYARVVFCPFLSPLIRLFGCMTHGTLGLCGTERRKKCEGFFQTPILAFFSASSSAPDCSHSGSRDLGSLYVFAAIPLGHAI